MIGDGNGNGNVEPKLPVQQLAILAICRFAEPVALTGVNPYLPEMIESFGLPSEDVAKWAGVTSAAFSLTQAFTSFFWQWLSDRFGRKISILAALMAAMGTTVLFGFSTSLTWAVVARCLSGAANGNAGVVRTMVAELVPQRSLQPRAFSLMPLVWSTGSVFGPILGGALASPAKNFPSWFGDNDFFIRYPFALANLVAASLFLGGVGVGILFLKETMEPLKWERDHGLVIGKWLTRTLWPRCNNSPQWLHDQGMASPVLRPTSQGKMVKRPISWSEVFTFQSNINLLVYVILSLHAVAFDQLVAVFLHLPVQNHSLENPEVHLPWKFGGGFAFESGTIGLMFTGIGVFAMLAQFLLFPPLAARYGILPCLRFCTLAFPIALILVPFSVLLPTRFLQQVGIFFCLMLKSFACIFAYPCSTVLLTNSAKSIRVLGALNAVAISVSALAKAVGPFVAGELFSRGLEKGYMILPWGVLAAIAVPGHISTWWLVELEGPSAGEEADAKEAVGSGVDVEEIALLDTVGDANDKEGDSGSEHELEDGLAIRRLDGHTNGHAVDRKPKEEDSNSGVVTGLDILLDDIGTIVNPNVHERSTAIVSGSSTQHLSGPAGTNVPRLRSPLSKGAEASSYFPSPPPSPAPGVMGKPLPSEKLNAREGRPADLKLP